jgi:hypothetical protein
MVECKEKRTDYRAPLGAKISWTIDDRQWHEASSHDISSDGMMLRTQQPVEEGSSVKLNFKLPNLKFQGTIVVEAEVVRVVQRQGRQIGLGLRFLTLRAGNYQSVKEFVSRILGLPLDSAMVEQGGQDGPGYTFKMDHLARKAEAGRAEAQKRQTAREEALQRKFMVRGWAWRGVKMGLFLIGGLIILKVAGFILDLTSRL